MCRFSVQKLETFCLFSLYYGQRATGLPLNPKQHILCVDTKAPQIYNGIEETSPYKIFR